ncbi:MAG: hypothetical protein IPF73_13410 [Betaproteobacteria bacterium]|nr:hypothetical protein [Betaproteobacteria bacterium]
MQKAHAVAVDDVKATPRLLHREGLDAVALGGGVRREGNAHPERDATGRESQPIGRRRRPWTLLDGAGGRRPGADRRQRHATPGAVRGALPSCAAMSSAGVLRDEVRGGKALSQALDARREVFALST